MNPAVGNPLCHRVRGCRGGRYSDASAERHRPPNNPPVCRALSPPLPAALSFPGAATSSPAVLPREGAKPTRGTGRPVPHGRATAGVRAPRVIPRPAGVCETAGGCCGVRAESSGLRAAGLRFAGCAASRAAVIGRWRRGAEAGGGGTEGRGLRRGLRRRVRGGRPR